LNERVQKMRIALPKDRRLSTGIYASWALMVILAFMSFEMGQLTLAFSAAL